MPTKKPGDEGKPKRARGERPGPRTADLAFEHIMEAILDANPEGVREHHSRRRINKKTKAGEKNQKGNDHNSNIDKPRS